MDGTVSRSSVGCYIKSWAPLSCSCLTVDPASTGEPEHAVIVDISAVWTLGLDASWRGKEEAEQ